MNAGASGAHRIRLLKFLPVFHAGGTEYQVWNLVRRLNRERFDIGFSCMKRSGSLVKEIEREGMRIDEYPLRHLYGFNTLRREIQFSRAMAGQRIHIMHSYNFYANAFAIPAARLARVPVVVASVRDLGVYLTPMQCRVHKMVCRLADRVIVNAEAIRNWLVEQGFPEHKINVIRNGVDVARFAAGDGAAVRREFGVPGEAPLVVMVARLNAKKGEDYFLEGAARVLDRCPGTHFLIVGESYTRGQDGRIVADLAYIERLAQRARGLGIGANVHFTGMREDIPDILAASSVSVLPSFSEGISNTVLESMAAGVPVVATRVGGTPEIIHDGEDGIMIPPGNAEAIAEAVSRIIEDPSLAARLSAKGRGRAEEAFSLDAMVRHTQDLYLELLASKGKLQ